jgi:hypothetical protein
MRLKVCSFCFISEQCERKKLNESVGRERRLNVNFGLSVSYKFLFQFAGPLLL